MNPTCDIDAGKTGVFGGADCIRGFHLTPVSGMHPLVIQENRLLKLNMHLI